MSAVEPHHAAAAPALKRRLGLPGATLSGIGIILGAGIYVLVGAATADAGSAVWASFLIAALLAAATGLSYAELAAMIPEAGASAAYASDAFGSRAGFLTGWLLVTITVTGAGAVALGFGGYSIELWPAIEGRLDAGMLLPASGVAIAVILAAAIVTYLGVRETIVVAGVMAVLEAGGLVLVIVLGLPEIGARSLLDAPDGLPGIVAGAALVFFAFQGFEEIATLAEETRSPERTIPTAIVLAIVVTTVLYLAVAVVAASAVAWPALAESNAPLADVVGALANERLADGLSVVALLATGNTVLLLLATGARLLYGMARRGLLPAPLARLAPGRRTPWVATLVVTAAALGFALAGEVGFVAQVTNFAVFVAFAIVNGAVIRLRLRDPDRPRPFRLPLAVRGVPATAVLGGAAALGLMLSLDAEAFVLGAATLAIGIALSFTPLRGDGRPESDAVEGASA